MKIIYEIYEKDWGNTNVTFTNEKSANVYADFLNKSSNSYYYVKPKNLYENMEDYIKYNKKEIKENINNAIKKILDKDTNFNLKFKNGIMSLNYSRIEEFAKNKKIDFTGWWDADNKFCKVTKGDLQVVINKYINLTEELHNYNSILLLLKQDKLESKTIKELEKTIEL